MNAARDGDNPIPLQGWAVRTLAKYPTEAAIKFLLEMLEATGEKGRSDLAQDVREALRLLSKLPEDTGRRYKPPHD